jgi:hypothetical protein
MYNTRISSSFQEPLGKSLFWPLSDSVSPSGISLSKLFLAPMLPMPYNKQNIISLPLSDGVGVSSEKTTLIRRQRMMLEEEPRIHV